MRDIFEENGAGIGDRVRVEYTVGDEPRASEGKLRMGQHRDECRYVGDALLLADDMRITNVIVLEKAPPPEPPVGSIIGWPGKYGNTAIRGTDDRWHYARFAEGDDYRAVRPGWVLLREGWGDE